MSSYQHPGSDGPGQVDHLRHSPPAVMNLAEAATYLAVSPRTLRYLVAGRAIKFARIGRSRGRITFKRSWLDEHVEQASRS